MSVDKLRRALLAQRQRIDDAQQQEETASTAATTAAPQPAAKRAKRKAQADDAETEHDHGIRGGSSKKAAVSNKSSHSSDIPTAALNQPQPAVRRSKQTAIQASKPASTTLPASTVSSSVSALSAKLASSRFRWLNEQLYTLPSAAAFSHFSTHPADYEAYHTGFRQQVQRWPSHPLDQIIAHLHTLSTPHTIADMGCGDARIAHTLVNSRHTVHSFDLVPASPLVTACNIRHTPLPPHSVDTLIYCLSLMPSDYQALLSEGLRILRPGGELIVAEVSSRLVEGGGVEGFVRGLEAMGVKRRKVVDNDYFALVWCIKNKAENETDRTAARGKKAKSDGGGRNKGREQNVKVVLTPCIYKKTLKHMDTIECLAALLCSPSPSSSVCCSVASSSSTTAYREAGSGCTTSRSFAIRCRSCPPTSCATSTSSRATARSSPWSPTRYAPVTDNNRLRFDIPVYQLTVYVSLVIDTSPDPAVMSASSICSFSSSA